MTKQEKDHSFRTFLPGIYRHYKGGLYRAIGLVAHHETREPWVLYVSLERGTMNVRPLAGEGDAWTDHVWPGAGAHGNASVPRFSLVNDSMDGLVPGAR